MTTASVPATQTGAGATAPTGPTALSSLSGNFSDFLKMLMTQLQNQDPTSPMDTNQFTSELVQFSSVEQQINTNTSLTQLIQLTQAGEVMQASAMTGRQVTVQASQIPLQNGKAAASFTAPAAEPVTIAITDSNGKVVRTDAVNAAKGANAWSWDGTDNAGNSVPDGAYGIAVTGYNADGSTAPLPFTVTGTASGVVSSAANGVQLQLGAVPVGFASIVSVDN